MKIFKRSSIAIVISLTLGTGMMTAQARGPSGYNNTSPAYAEQQTQSLDNDEAEGLLFMREEEKMARDVYMYLFNLWGHQVFNNIARAEQSHMDSVLNLLEKYNLEDSATGKAGTFNHPALQQLYNDLIAKGENSLVDALKAGVIIEEVDIDDIAELMAETDNADIIRVYSNLLAGSYNHLDAFINTLAANDSTDTSESQANSGSEKTGNSSDTNNPDSPSGTEFSNQINDESSDNYVAGMAIDTENNPLRTNTHFKNSLSTASGLSGNHLNISEHDPVRITTHIAPDSRDNKQLVEYLALIHYEGDNGDNGTIMRSGETWEPGSGTPQALTSAEEHTLSYTQEFHVFEGTLEQLRGQFTVFVGYRLENGDIVYNPEPVQFRVH